MITKPLTTMCGFKTVTPGLSSVLSRRLAIVACMIGIGMVAVDSQNVHAQATLPKGQVSPVVGVSTPAPGTQPVEHAAILDQIQQAARTLSYSGIFTYQQGPVIESSRIAHMLVDGVEREKLEVLDACSVSTCVSMTMCSA